MLAVKAIALVIMATLTFLAVLYLLVLMPAGVTTMDGARNVLKATLRGDDLAKVLRPDTVAVAPPDTVRYGPPVAPIAEQLASLEEEVMWDSTSLVQTQSDTSALLRQIEELAQQRKAMEESKYVDLARLYEAMKPDAAAAILVNLDDAKVIKILNRMKERQAAKIMTSGAMPAERAARITKLMRESER